MRHTYGGKLGWHSGAIDNLELLTCMQDGDALGANRIIEPSTIREQNPVRAVIRLIVLAI
jgi:hypothetical protein